MANIREVNGIIVPEKIRKRIKKGKKQVIKRAKVDT